MPGDPIKWGQPVERRGGSGCPLLSILIWAAVGAAFWSGILYALGVIK